MASSEVPSEGPLTLFSPPGPYWVALLRTSNQAIRPGATPRVDLGHPAVCHPLGGPGREVLGVTVLEQAVRDVTGVAAASGLVPHPGDGGGVVVGGGPYGCHDGDGTVDAMGQLSMSPSERDALLADVHVGVLAVERSDRPPLAAPVWYRYEGGVVEITTEAESLKAQALHPAGRASLCVQREAYPYAYVTVEGPVAFTEATREQRVAIASRYLGPEVGEAYVASTDGGDYTALVLTPETWRTVDYAKL